MKPDTRRDASASEEALERLADRELRRLPLPRAPQTLLPRVMAAVEAWAARPWYSRAWFTWPAGWQAVSVAALALVVAGGVLFAPRVEAAASNAFAAVQMFAGGVTDVAPVETTAHSARILWRTLLEPLATYALVVVVLMVLACAIFGTALNHVVIERAEQR
jgi:hypothetical protein